MLYVPRSGVTVRVAMPEAFRVALPNVVLPELKTTVPDGGTDASPRNVATSARGWPCGMLAEETVRVLLEVCSCMVTVRAGDAAAKFWVSPA